MINDFLTHENPFRTIYERQAFYVWLLAFIVANIANHYSGLPQEPFYWIGTISIVMCIYWLYRYFPIARFQRSLKGKKLSFISLKKLERICKKNKNDIWLGYGFRWETRHTQLITEILTRDWSLFESKEAKKDRAIGHRWIHGIEPIEKQIRQPLDHSEGQNLIVGTTGSGKTRLFDLLITQAIMRNEAVIIIDPKGDKELRNNAKRACKAIGKEDRFLFYHPAFPDESVRIDPLKNFSRVTELASRLAALIPSEAGADPFKSFGWQAVNNIAQALVMSNQKPTIKSIKRYLEGGPSGILLSAIEGYTRRSMENGDSLLDQYLKSSAIDSDDKKARIAARFYSDHVEPVSPSSELAALISMFEHDRVHFSKMVANLLPIMNMLTAGEMGDLLSPDYKDTSDSRIITDSKKIIDNENVFYCGLDSLPDSVTSSANGSLILADLVAVAGDRYNFGLNNRPVNIFIDEAAEVINEPVIQLLNKGRGAKMKMFIATQTISDFTTRLGSEDKAMQVLGNVNNFYCLRTLDPKTQEFISKNLPETRIKNISRTQGTKSDSNSPLRFSSNHSESQETEKENIFPPQLFGMLPNLEYISKTSGGIIRKCRIPILH